MLVDLADFSSIKNFVDELQARVERLLLARVVALVLAAVRVAVRPLAVHVVRDPDLADEFFINNIFF